MRVRHGLLQGFSREGAFRIRIRALGHVAVEGNILVSSQAPSFSNSVPSVGILDDKL